MSLSNFRRIHFTGIGGIGMSALALFFISQGAKVSGSDLVQSSNTDDLKKKGARVKIGPHKKENVPEDTELFIYTAAAKSNNPEIRKAKKNGIPTLSYPEVLGELTKEKSAVVISGTHGKSTTTSLAGLLLWRAGFDPTVIVGTKIKEFGSAPFRRGESQWLVAEADDYQAGYLGYWPHQPKILIITTIDLEHVDVFPTLRRVKKSFRELAEKVPGDGAIIANRDDENVRDVLKGLEKKIHYYSLRDGAAGKIRKVTSVPGEHNISNALAVWQLGKRLEIPEKTILETIASFRGTWRRFEFKGTLNGAIFIEDYGHHPAEIQATLQAAREKFKERLKKGKLWCIFQPHQYQRTKYLFKEFTGAFDQADYLLLLDIFGVPGREKKSIIKSVSSEMLAQAIKGKGEVGVIWVKGMSEAAKLLELAVNPNDVCIVMGAGNVGKVFQEFKHFKANALTR